MYNIPMDIYDDPIEEYCKNYTLSVCRGCILFQKQAQEVKMMSPEEKWNSLRSFPSD